MSRLVGDLVHAGCGGVHSVWLDMHKLTRSRRGRYGSQKTPVGCRHSLHRYSQLVLKIDNPHRLRHCHGNGCFGTTGLGWWGGGLRGEVGVWRWGMEGSMPEVGTRIGRERGRKGKGKDTPYWVGRRGSGETPSHHPTIPPPPHPPRGPWGKKGFNPASSWTPRTLTMPMIALPHLPLQATPGSHGPATASSRPTTKSTSS